MDQSRIRKVLTPEAMNNLFPMQRSNDFFEAFYGGSEDSHFDIRLEYEGANENKLFFSFLLLQRPGKCLACNMTYGLPHVFARHPIINVQGLVADIGSMLEIDPSRLKWDIGNTSQRSSDIHFIPLVLSMD